MALIDTGVEYTHEDLAVYTGDAFNALTAVAHNDDYSTLKTGRLSFAPTSGATYFIVVDGKVFADINRDAPPMGGIVLNWYRTPPPTFLSGAPFAPGEGVWGTEVTLSGTNFTGVTGVLFDGVSATFTNHPDPRFTDLRITATVPTGAGRGPVTLCTAHGNSVSATDFVAHGRVSCTVSPTEPVLWVDWAGGGFVLESTELLEPPAWAPVLQTPTPVEGGSRTVLVLPFDGGARFFRWKGD